MRVAQSKALTPWIIETLAILQGMKGDCQQR